MKGYPSPEIYRVERLFKQYIHYSVSNDSGSRAMCISLGFELDDVDRPECPKVPAFCPGKYEAKHQKFHEIKSKQISEKIGGSL